jgi:hypothetical protein
MKLVVATDCAGDPVARSEIAAHWYALGGQDIAIEQLPVALSHARQPEATSVAAITLFRSLGTTRQSASPSTALPATARTPTACRSAGSSTVAIL